MVAEDEIATAVAALRRGGLVAFPTETVYGLGCDAESSEALARLYSVKRRPRDHPVIVHLGVGADLTDWSDAGSPAARVLTDACWPGPLTVVVARRARVPDEATGGRDTVALRVPDQPIALALLEAFGGGIAAPSANRYGRVSPTTAADVRADLDDDVDVVLDGGPCAVGVESTIVDCSSSEPVVVRLGGVSRERIEELLGQPVAVRSAGEVAAPGTHAAHYAPDASVLVVDDWDEACSRASALLAEGRGVGVLGLAPAPDVPDGAVALGTPGSTDEYARLLYQCLRDADRRALDVVLAVPPPERGLGAAVADRLCRAAAGSVAGRTVTGSSR